MARRLDSLRVPASALHYDDGVSELDPEPTFDWSTIYGRSPEMVAEQADRGAG